MFRWKVLEYVAIDRHREVRFHSQVENLNLPPDEANPVHPVNFRVNRCESQIVCLDLLRIANQSSSLVLHKDLSARLARFGSRIETTY